MKANDNSSKSLKITGGTIGVIGAASIGHCSYLDFGKTASCKFLGRHRLTDFIALRHPDAHSLILSVQNNTANSSNCVD